MGLNYRQIINAFFLLLLTCTLSLALLSPGIHEPPKRLTAREMRQDLYQLLTQIDQYSAFLPLAADTRRAALQARARALMARFDTIEGERFAAEVIKLLNLLGDPDARLSLNFRAKGHLPAQLRPLENAWLALDADDKPLDPDYPFITHIDGVPLNRWVEACQHYLPQALKQSRTLQSEWLSRLNLLRQDLGVAVRPKVMLTLSRDYVADALPLDADASVKEVNNRPSARPREKRSKESVRQLSLKVPERFERKQSKQLNRFERLDGDAALVALRDLTQFEQDRQQQGQLQSAMTSSVMVLDLRHAKGFSPSLLSQISSYGDAEPENSLLGLARYRLAPGLRSDFLSSMGYGAASDAELANIGDRAEPLATSAGFSAWFSRSQRQAPADTEQRRLIMLIGPECRQDCEWLASRAKLWPRATLVGEQTAGNLGKDHQFRLANSRLDIAFSATLVFDAKGTLLSGVGTTPDILLPYNEEIQWQGLLSLLRPHRPSLAQATTAGVQLK